MSMMEVCVLYRYLSVLLVVYFARDFCFCCIVPQLVSGKKKKAKTQEGSLRNSVNFCTIPVALSFCKMCCLTYASLVVFVLYHDIDRAVYAPVTLSSFFFLFFPWNECARLCLRIYSFSWLLFVQVQPLFLSERSTYERAFIFQCQSWLEFLSEVLSWCHRMTGTRCVVTLCHLLLFFVFLPQTMNFTLKISSISFGCTKCRCVTCVRLYICGANLHSWCMFLFF